MAFTEFCCRSGGSNLNAGTRTGNSTEPGTGADFTYASGTWVASTGVFTVASGNPQSDGVAVGDFASVYPDGSTVAVFIGRVTARSTTTITVSLTAKSGTAPTDGTNTRTLKIGGAWKGPNAAEGFPFNFAAAAMTNASADPPRVNFKNDASYSITAGATHTLIGPVNFWGYTTSYGDFGKATIDGGTSGASYALVTLSGSGVAGTYCYDLIFQNNGASGSANGVECGAGGRAFFVRCVVNSVRGSGFNATAMMFECEAYACNQSNTANLGGFALGASSLQVRCVSHDNSGANNNGFYCQVDLATLVNCIADTNGLHGVLSNNSTSAIRCLGCDFYNNGGDGYRHATAATAIYLENCNFVKNGGYGFNISSGTIYNALLFNCGFGAGTQVNTSGTTNGGSKVVEVGSVTYASNVSPWVDPANGDFRINLSTAKGAGRGKYTQTAASYTGTVGYPDIGAAQHVDSGGSSGGASPIGLGSPVIRAVN